MNISIFKAFCLLFWSKLRTSFIIFCAISLLFTLLPYLTLPDFIHKLFLFIPLYTFFYTIFIFSFGDTNTSLSGESNFPSHFFILPVKTPTLLVWPMILGSCFMFYACFQADQVWLKPQGIEIDYWWAAPVAVSLLVWFQAIVWQQYRTAWTSIILVCFLLTAFVFISYFIFYNKDKVSIIVTFLLLQLGVACYLVLRAVSRARKGVILEPWKWTRRFSFSFARINRTHKTPFQAQCYIENRLHGLILPVMIIFMGLFYLMASLLILFSNEGPERISKIVLMAVFNILPTFMMIYILSAGWFTFISSDWYKYNNASSMPEQNVIPNFFSTLPITNQDIIKAKFISFAKNAVDSFLISLGFSLVIFAIYLIVSYPDIAFPPFLYQFGLAKAITALIIIPVLGLVFTILGSMSNMWLWLIRKIYLWIVISPAIIFVLIKEIWIDASWKELGLTYYPWLVGIICTVKLVLMCYFLPWLIKNKYYRVNTIIKSVAAWIVFMSICFTFVIWISPIKLSYALIWGCLVFITPILGLLGAPAALKISRTQ